MSWQLQEAKQRFSEVARRAKDDGPQIVTRHGEEDVVVMDVTEYRRLLGRTKDFKELLFDGPGLEDLDLTRPAELPREIDLGDAS
ncbi:type II toxin-antitoxin system Phd/YefM family antitoxin [Nocardiopsis gilva YIM 90087]|uniref:Antitoxin n=1 Tax=Nocardiopsis gilva YIM 90087 TaxID=1235441 RepID=A0A223SDA6_9ACTN|nr:type II toxin-antitoxin system Phd/YefM family antitoxin [Nocardiopsis gilva]ASU86128.1 type II toxin-antitoxin system Phd/YefM family antitoxin [Nocardiopsis gilva YIM 90087]